MREQYRQQLTLLETPLKRIKLKFFGNSGVGKSRLIQALQGQAIQKQAANFHPSQTINSFMDKFSINRRFSDNILNDFLNSDLSSEFAKRSSDLNHHRRNDENNELTGISISSRSAKKDLLFSTPKGFSGFESDIYKYLQPVNSSYTTGIDVQNIMIPSKVKHIIHICYFCMRSLLRFKF